MQNYKISYKTVTKKFKCLKQKLFFFLNRMENYGNNILKHCVLWKNYEKIDYNFLKRLPDSRKVC